MRKMLKALSLPICAMLLFSACASSLNLRPGPFRSEMQEFRSADDTYGSGQSCRAWGGLCH